MFSVRIFTWIESLHARWGNLLRLELHPAFLLTECCLLDVLEIVCLLLGCLVDMVGLSVKDVVLTGAGHYRLTGVQADHLTSLEILRLEH